MENQEHGAEYHRQWRKLHLVINAETPEIRAMEVTSNSIGDAPVLPDLLAQIPSDEILVSVVGGAYDPKGCCAAIASRAAEAAQVMVNTGKKAPRGSSPQ